MPEEKQDEKPVHLHLHRSKKFCGILRVMPDSPDITQLLQAWSHGAAAALERLLALVYDELQRQAARYLRKERLEHTLQTTALIHEAYLKLLRQTQVEWQTCAHFFALRPPQCGAFWWLTRANGSGKNAADRRKIWRWKPPSKFLPRKNQQISSRWMKP